MGGGCGGGGRIAHSRESTKVVKEWVIKVSYVVQLWAVLKDNNVTSNITFVCVRERERNPRSGCERGRHSPHGQWNGVKSPTLSQKTDRRSNVTVHTETWRRRRKGPGTKLEKTTSRGGATLFHENPGRTTWLCTSIMFRNQKTRNCLKTSLKYGAWWHRASRLAFVHPMSQGKLCCRDKWSHW